MAHESDIFVGLPTTTSRTQTTIPGFEELRTRSARRIEEFLADPLRSQLFTSTLTPQLAALIPSEQLATRNLTDLFRRGGAGTLQSGAFADAARRHQGDILQNRSSLVARTANETLNTLMRGLGLNIDLLRSLRPTSEATERTSNVPERLPPIGAGGEFGGADRFGGGGSAGADRFSGFPSFPSLAASTPRLPAGFAFRPGFGDRIPGFGFGSIVGPGDSSVTGAVTGSPRPTSGSDLFFEPESDGGGGFPITFDPFTGSYSTFNPNAANAEFIGQHDISDFEDSEF